MPQSIGQIDESLQNLGQGNMNQSNAFDMPSDFQRGTSMVPDDQNNFVIDADGMPDHSDIVPTNTTYDVIIEQATDIEAGSPL